MRTKIVRIEQRRICWPDPDATCLEGGCIYCNDHPFRNVGEIARYAQNAELVEHRGGQRLSGWEAYLNGRRNYWGNALVRTVPRRVRV